MNVTIENKTKEILLSLEETETVTVIVNGILEIWPQSYQSLITVKTRFSGLIFILVIEATY